jgi:hypothetical protein
MDDGWDGLNVVDFTSAHQKDDDLKRLDRAFARTFETDEGKKVLEYLVDKTLNQPTWIPGGGTSFGFAREGQNSIIREILQRIERTKK